MWPRNPDILMQRHIYTISIKIGVTGVTHSWKSSDTNDFWRYPLYPVSGNNGKLRVTRPIRGNRIPAEETIWVSPLSTIPCNHPVKINRFFEMNKLDYQLGWTHPDSFGEAKKRKDGKKHRPSSSSVVLFEPKLIQQLVIFDLTNHHILFRLHSITTKDCTCKQAKSQLQKAERKSDLFSAVTSFPLRSAGAVSHRAGARPASAWHRSARPW